MKNPEDDPTWPTCEVHQERHWCDNVRNYLISGQDGKVLSPGVRTLIPIVPTYGLYCEVSLDVAVIAGMMVSLSFVREVDMFSVDEELVEFGMHTLGEGRLTIASSLADWMEGFEPPKCEYHAHSYKQEMELQRDKGNEYAIKANRGTISLYGKCLACWQHEQTAPVGNLPSFDAGSFGLDNTVTEGRSDPKSTRDLLKGRFSL